MIALDTNVLVRLLTRDDEQQAEKVRQLFEQQADEDGSLFISDIVLAELAWTLERAYGYERDSISLAINALADNASLRFESHPVLQAAQALFAGTKAGFADCLIVAKARARGCASLLTFDKAMRGLPDVALL